MSFRVLSVAAVMMVMAGAAPGDIVEVELEGAVTSAGASFGDLVAATFRYDSAASATGTSTSGGVVTKFYGPATLVSFVLGGNTWGDASWGKQSVRPTSDWYRVEWGSASSPSLAELILEFTGPGGTFDDGSLPTVKELQALTQMQGAFRSGSSLLQFDFDTSEVRVVAVPLPPAAWAGFAGLGAVGLMGAARRRRMAG